MWGFGEGMALLGLLRAGTALGRPQWIDAVADFALPTPQGDPGPVDHLIAVDVLAELHRLRPAIDIDSAVARFVRAVWHGEAPTPTHRPDLPELCDTVWVDCMHTDGPGLALAGMSDAATAAIMLARARLQDLTGLFSHGYSVTTRRANGVHWGRGQGWALHGLIGARDRDGVQSLLNALSAVELDGQWRTIVDSPHAPIEHSVSALVASGIYRALRTGIVDASWRALADRAMHSALQALDGNGGLPVSSATPAGLPAVYLDRTTGIYPWGQGPLLLALLDRENL